jgi:hypothetical protein
VVSVSSISVSTNRMPARAEAGNSPSGAGMEPTGKQLSPRPGDAVAERLDDPVERRLAHCHSASPFRRVVAARGPPPYLRSAALEPAHFLSGGRITECAAAQ